MAINVGSVAVSVVPDASRFNALLKEKLRDLTATIKLDVDTAGVTARLDEVKAKVDELGMKSPSIRVDVDSAGAVAQLAAVGAEADKTADKNKNLGNSSSSASGGMLSLMQVAIGLSPALVPVGAAAIGVAAALGTMAAAGAAGVGILSMAIANVTSAVKLLGQQQTAQAAASAASAAQAGVHAQAIVSAQQQVQSAQYGLVQADQAEQNALIALQSAREAATRQLQSMANQAVDARLAEKQAVLDVETATTNYRNTMASATATDQQKAQASLDLQKAQQHLTEAHQAATNAQVDNTKAQKAGVDGAPQVVSATQAVANAHHGQEQAAQALSNALTALATAQKNSGAATSASLTAINAKVAALDPTVRSFAEYLRGTWAPIWKQVQGAADGGLLPGVREGLDAVRPLMPGFIAFVRDLAQRMGDMAAAAGRAFNSPFWQSFFAFMQRTMGPVLTALGHILGDVATGFAGLWMAFEPIIMPITKGIEGMAGQFAKFGEQASTSAGFGKFIAYIRQVGPMVLQTLGDLWRVVVHVVEALAPLGGPILMALDTLAQIINRIPVKVLTGAAVAFGAIYAGMKLVQGISALASLGPWGLVAVAVAGVFLLVYTNSKTFRDFINDKVLPTLQEWWGWIKQNVLPALQELGDWISKTLVPVLAGIFMDAWNGITNAVKTVSRAFSSNRGEMKQVGDVLATLVGFIVRDVVPLLGTILKVAFETLGRAIGVVIGIIAGLVDSWNNMWGLGKSLGSWFANDFVGFFEGAWKKIHDGWDSLVSGLAKLWNNLKHYMMDPVAFIVDVVINKGLIAAWDWVVSHLHLPGSWHADAMDVPAVPPLMAHGGVLPGYAPGQDTVHAILSPGEGVLVPEAVRGLGGAGAINAINSAYSSRRGGNSAGHFGLGGVVSSLLGFLGRAAPGGLVAGFALAGNKDAQRLAAIEQDPIGAIKGIASAAMGGLSSAAPMLGLLTDMVGRMASGVGQSIKDHLLSLLGSLGGNFGAGTPASQAPSSQAANVAIVKSWASPYGWQSGPEWDALVSVVNRESGFRNTAQNPTSSAYGMFQFLDSTWASMGGRKTSDPTIQAQLGMKYLSQVYGDPLAALRHEQAFGWYDKGGLLPPGPSLVYNGTGAPELVAPRQSFEQVMSGATGGRQAGPATFHLYDVNGELLGSMRGIAAEEAADTLTMATSRGDWNRS